MRLNRRPFAVVGAITVVVVGAIGLTAVTAPAAVAGCKVDYSVTSQWTGGFGANVTVTNLGDPVTSWKLTWSFPAGQTVTSLWNGTVSQSASAVTVTNASWNGSVGTNGSASFGFNGTWTGSNPSPTSFAFNGTACTTGGPTASATQSSPTTSPSPSVSPTTSPSPSVSPTTSPSASPTTNPSTTYTNPVVWQDFADGDIIRVGDTYYYSASTMHYSPGATILRSYDLVNWEYAGHSVPKLDFDSTAYDLTGGQAYVKGI